MYDIAKASGGPEFLAFLKLRQSSLDSQSARYMDQEYHSLLSQSFFTDVVVQLKALPDMDTDRLSLITRT